MYASICLGHAKASRPIVDTPLDTASALDQRQRARRALRIPIGLAEHDKIRQPRFGGS
jgi:hypothetical protein